MNEELEPRFLFTEGPRCESCTRPILDARSGLLAWNRHERGRVVFDGFHFVHKGRCDPHRAYISSLPLDRAVSSPRELIVVLADLAIEMSALESTTREHWASFYTTFAWLARWGCEVASILPGLGAPISLASPEQISREADRVARSLASAA